MKPVLSTTNVGPFSKVSKIFKMTLNHCIYERMAWIASNAMQAFVAVADLQGFAPAAAKTRGCRTRRDAADCGVEERLGARMLQRNTRQVALTEVGARYLAASCGFSPRSRSRRLGAGGADAGRADRLVRQAPIGSGASISAR